MKLLAGILSLFTSFFFGSDAEIKTEVPIYEAVYEKDGLFTINKNFDLLYLNGDKSIVIDKDVLSFQYDDDYIVYTKTNNEDGADYELVSLNLYKNEKEVIETIPYDSYILEDDTVYITNDYNVVGINLETKKSKTVFKSSTNDIVFHDIENNILLISYLKNKNTKLVAINTETCKKIGETPSIGRKYIIKDDSIYGINYKDELFRAGRDEKIEVVEGIEIVKFFIYDDMIVYLDITGKLNILDLNGSNRHLASNILDFKVFNNTIYYTTSIDDKLYKTRMNSNDKSIVLSGVSSDLYLDIVD